MNHSEAGKLGAIVSQKRYEQLKNERINKYLSCPAQCKYCSNSLSYERRKNKFCSRSCAAIHNNARHPKRIKTTNRKSSSRVAKNKSSLFLFCDYCTIPFFSRYTNVIYCSKRCHAKQLQDRLWREVVQKIENGECVSPVNCKRYLLEKFGNACQECGWNKINLSTNKVPLDLEHIDGNSENNTKDNIKLLCPNCHSLTPTYKALNKGKGRFKRRQRFLDGKSF